MPKNTHLFRRSDMEEQNLGFPETQLYRNGFALMSPEIVEISEEIKSVISSRDGGNNDIYVAVYKDDLDVLKWALDHAVLPGSRVFLIHIYPPVTHIPTPVGRLSKTQVSKDQVQTYIREETNRRRNLLQKYIRMCNDAKVPVDTMLVESDQPAKAILELISVLNINTLVMGTKRSSTSRRLRKGIGKSKFVQQNAPPFCEVIIVSNGQKVVEENKVGPEPASPVPSTRRRPATIRNGERNFFECACFPGRFK